MGICSLPDFDGVESQPVLCQRSRFGWHAHTVRRVGVLERKNTQAPRLLLGS